MRKKLMSAVSCVIALLIAVFSVVSANAALTLDGISYENYEDNTLIVTGYSGEDTTLVIPEFAYDTAVKRINNDALSGNTVIKKLVMNDEMTNILGYAVKGCTNLESVYFSEKLIAIWNYAFSGNTALKAAMLGNTKVSTLYTGAFDGDTALKYVSLPDTLEKIGANAFAKTAIKNMVIPDSVTEIGGRCFNNDSALEALYIPESVVTFGDKVFRNCSNLTVYGIAGSAAETYCSDNSVKFTAVTKAEFPSDIPGDVDNDGKLTSKDAKAVVNELNGSDETFIAQNCDYNGDGELTEADADAIVSDLLAQSFTVADDDTAYAKFELSGDSFGAEQILGVQKKPGTSDGIRFLSTVSSALLLGADDYGYVFSTASGSIADARAAAEEKMTVEVYGSKASCVGSTNSLSGEYGSADFTTTDYKYITSAINEIDDRNAVIAARLYLTVNGKTYYGKYINGQGAFTACTANLACFDN